MSDINGVVIQHAFGEHAELLKLTDTRHHQWAAQHQLGFHSSYGPSQTIRRGAWDKIPTIIYWLNTPVEAVIWLDADTLVTDLSHDPRETLDDGCDIAMIQSPHKEFGYNAGVMYIRNSEPIRKFFRTVWDKGPVHGHKLCYLADECRINQELPNTTLKVRTLDWRWNYFYTVQATSVGVDPNLADETCIVRAWHGTPPTTVARRIAERLRTCQS